MRLMNCFVDIFVYVGYLLKTDRYPDYEQVRKNVIQLMSQSEMLCEQWAFPHEDYDLAKFAVCAWIDEILSRSVWPEKNKWKMMPLQSIYYGTSGSEHAFFDYLNTLQPHQKDVREVYYYCLAMGFMGRYCDKWDKYLIDQLKRSNLKLLADPSWQTLGNEILFPTAYLPAGTGKKGRYIWGSAFFLEHVRTGIPIALLAGVYIIFQLILNNTVETIVHMVP